MIPLIDERALEECCGLSVLPGHHCLAGQRFTRIDALLPRDALHGVFQGTLHANPKEFSLLRLHLRIPPKARFM